MELFLDSVDSLLCDCVYSIRGLFLNQNNFDNSNHYAINSPTICKLDFISYMKITITCFEWRNMVDEKAVRCSFSYVHPLYRVFA